MDLRATLKSINAVQIKFAEKHAGGFDRPYFGIAPDWLKQAYASKKLKMYISAEIDYMCWSIDNEYGQPIVFYPYDWIVTDGNGKIFGLEEEVVRILNGES